MAENFAIIEAPFESDIATPTENFRLVDEPEDEIHDEIEQLKANAPDVHQRTTLRASSRHRHVTPMFRQTYDEFAEQAGANEPPTLEFDLP